MSVRRAPLPAGAATNEAARLYQQLWHEVGGTWDPPPVAAAEVREVLPAQAALEGPSGPL